MSNKRFDSALPICTDLEPALRRRVAELGRAWARSPARPRIDPELARHWDDLVAKWSRSKTLPLVVRKRSGGDPGVQVLHRSSRRPIVFSDNSPAQWTFMRAYLGERPSLASIQRLLEEDAFPFSFVSNAEQRSRMAYKCPLAVRDCVNRSDWKLCHIEAVGLKAKTAVVDMDLDRLVEHTRLLLSPSNHFLVPLKWGGLGELREFIDAVAAVDHPRRTRTRAPSAR